MTIKLKGSTDGSVSFTAPADTSPTGTDKTFTLPAADGTNGQVLSTNGSGVLSFVNQTAPTPAFTGLQCDQWYLTADITSNGVLTGLSRNGEAANGVPVGTGMTQSSGVFTFPATGIWLVAVCASFIANNDDSVECNIYATTNNSSYSVAAKATDGNNGNGQRHGGATAIHIVDVTDTSNVKVRFQAGGLATGSRVRGDAATMETHMTFIRLGDT